MLLVVYSCPKVLELRLKKEAGSCRSGLQRPPQVWWTLRWDSAGSNNTKELTPNAQMSVMGKCNQTIQESLWSVLQFANPFVQHLAIHIGSKFVFMGVDIF
jgi:hypothetical protein